MAHTDRGTDFDLLMRGERKRIVAQVGCGQGVEDVARAWPHYGKAGIAGGDVGDRRGLPGYCPSQCGEVALPSTGATNDSECVVRDSADGEVGFDSAFLV